MRIQHNIMAMNAYRNYNTNTSALSKNLEKLSSGYKINRAGDDAAGLAISEKMRAQITGLNAAQKNVKDGISLVKTAEGAMQEIQDMLNRMDYLATQSANGTYDNEVDRANLQKEVDALKSEIDRIADSANFNGIKLMDGSLDTEVKTTVNDPTIIGQKAFGSYDNAVEGTANDPQLHKNSTGEAKTSFTVGFNDLKVQAREDGKKTIVDLAFGRPVDGTASTDTAAGGATAGNENAPAAGGFPAVYDSGYIELTGKQAGENYTGADIAQAIYDKISQGGGTIKLDLTTDMTANADGTAQTPGADAIEYEVKMNDDGTLTFTMTDAGYNKAVEIYNKNNDADNANDVTVHKNPFEANFTVAVSTTDPSNRDESARYMGSIDVNVGGPSTGTQLAQTVVSMDKIFSNNGANVKDGAGIKVGDTSYVFAATDKTANAQYGDNVKVVDIRDLVESDDPTTFKTDLSTSGLNQALSRLTQVAKDNKMFSVEVTKDSSLGNGSITFSEKEGYNGDGKDGRTDLTTKPGLAEQLQYFTGITANVETTPAKGKALTLQIGDTSDSYNQLAVKIGDMHTKALGIGDLRIDDPASASAAIQTIKDAINQVSSVRGDLGATQNRLEHTANNLSVMAENIQDAESTIRDTDVAEEMMAYTKNNILIQSAQAMLAQANAVPQGVLQLLG